MEEINNVEILDNVEVLSVGTWLRNIFVQIIPILGIVMLFVWAYGDNTSLDMKNWAKAGVIISAIMFILTIISYIGG